MPRLSLSRLLPVLIAAMAIVLSVKVYAVAQALDGNGQAFTADGLTTTAHAAGLAQTPHMASSPTSVSQGASVPPASGTASPPDQAMPSLNACDHDVACKGKPAAAASVAGDPGLVDDIAGRQRQLDAEAAALEDRKHAMEAAEAALQQRVMSITTSETALHQSEQHDIALSNDDASRLVKIYQAMKPADAAAIFNILDLRVSARLLGLMDPRHASAIMGAMLPQRAILATQILAKSHALPAVVAERAG